MDCYTVERECREYTQKWTEQFYAPKWHSHDFHEKCTFVLAAITALLLAMVVGLAVDVVELKREVETLKAHSHEVVPNSEGLG